MVAGVGIGRRAFCRRLSWSVWFAAWFGRPWCGLLEFALWGRRRRLGFLHNLRSSNALPIAGEKRGVLVGCHFRLALHREEREGE